MLQENSLQTDKGSAAVIEGAARRGNVVVVCEHAGTAIPDALNNLGLDADALNSHVAWDPGAAKVAGVLARLLDAPLVKQRYSRLVYDCNRPPTSRDAMRDVSETTRIPGNENLSDDDKAWRIGNIYEPFHAAVADLLEARDGAVLVTIHSFTPVYLGRVRAVEIGLLHDEDSRLADAMLADEALTGGNDVRRNEPYGPADGVTHTLQLHGISRGIPNIMIEIRNDLINDDDACEQYAERLARALASAIGKVQPETNKSGGST